MFYLAPLKFLLRKKEDPIDLKDGFTYELTRATHPMRDFRKLIKLIKMLNEISGTHVHAQLAGYEDGSPGFFRIPQLESFLRTVIYHWQLSNKDIDKIAGLVKQNKQLAEALKAAVGLGNQYARLFILK